MFNRSRDYGFQYQHFVGDGDSSAYNAVISMNDGQGPYDIPVVKLECINHYQKKLGTKLRKLVELEKVDFENKKGKVIKRSTFGGKNKLSVPNIDKLTSYFGRAIRSNVGTTAIEMRRGMMATYFHVFENKHGACPLKKDSYCRYQKQIAAGIPKERVVYHGSSLKINLDVSAKEKVKSLYRSLVSEDDIKKLLPGYTQNANESLHSKVWRVAGKCKLLGMKRLDIVTKDTILTHCIGYEWGSFLKSVHLGSKGLDESLRVREKRRIESSRTVPKKKKKVDAKTYKDYVPGGF